MLLKRRGQKGLACSLKFNFAKRKETNMCGILGIVSKDRDVLGDGIVLLGAENHRGEQACGAAVFDGSNLRYYHGQGLVREVFGKRDQAEWSQLKGSVCVMQTLYSTIGDGTDTEQPKTQQPVAFKFNGVMGAIAHNGNLVRLKKLRAKAKKAARNRGLRLRTAN